ncbi:hypothetical protein BT96DRAFT_1002662 [Gymnopus androsaceus JB14]|uniref:Uncharacterized protein n=1 Tax=Gymnopus androsaceus JB14 TaxID=1447944 RepID=A0A6A4GX72_9AGAR|nr:hypothetical protein BT96DRAFT_1002662 [Gymnopus androsaceus JB14]
MGRPLWSVVLREKEKAKTEKEKQLAIPYDSERVENAWGSVDTTGNGLWGTSNPCLWGGAWGEDSGGWGRHDDNSWGAPSDSAWAGGYESDSTDPTMPPLASPTTVLSESASDDVTQRSRSPPPSPSGIHPTSLERPTSLGHSQSPRRS